MDGRDLFVSSAAKETGTAPGVIWPVLLEFQVTENGQHLDTQHTAQRRRHTLPHVDIHTHSARVPKDFHRRPPTHDGCEQKSTATIFSCLVPRDWLLTLTGLTGRPVIREEVLLMIVSAAAPATRVLCRGSARCGLHGGREKRKPPIRRSSSDHGHPFLTACLAMSAAAEKRGWLGAK